MGNVRVYVLARELGISSAEMLERLRSDGHDMATASSAVGGDIAARYRGKPPAGGAASRKGPAKKGKPGKKAPAAALPDLPPPKPIQRRAKAVKPQVAKPQTEEERQAAEERRQQRLARLRGVAAGTPPASPVEEEPAAVPVEQVAEPPAESPASVAEPEAVEEVAASATEAVAESPAETPTTPEPLAEEVASASPGQGPDSAASGQPAVRPGRKAPGSPSGKDAGPLVLPHVVRPASPPPAPAEKGPAAPTPAEAPAAAASARPAVTRPTREFRGPIRKITLPPQPPRPSAGRPPGAGITRTFTNRPGTGLGKHKKRKGKHGAANAPAPVAAPAPVLKGEGRIIRLTEGVSVKELADKMDVKAKDIIRILMMRGMMVTVNAALEPDLAKSLAEEFGFSPEVVSFEEDLQAQESEDAAIEESDETGQWEPRPPIVTVMGHVDHGKTSILDAIRQTNVASGEAGGITQSIGAYQVKQGGHVLTFVDTPGHEAFTTMRARGAQVTDLVVLVVAATDGVMPQTIEAINHAKAAEVPLVVAVNKIDLPNARPERVKSDLMNHGIVVEDFGGEVVSCPVSATTGEGLPALIEMIHLSSEILELKAMPTRRATGIVLEAGVDRGKGAVANIIVQDGTLRPGDAFIVGSEYGRVRALLDDQGGRIEEALPSSPAQVTGLNGVPKAGDRLQVVESEARAKEISEFRQHKRRERELAKSGPRGTLQDLSRAIAEGEAKELRVIVKADVHGAVEVLNKTIEELGTDKVRTKIIHSGTGAITDSDVLLATASEGSAIIVGFNVRPERSAAELADREKVIIRLHTVIYHLTDELKGVMAGLLDVIREEEFLGRAEVRQTFKVPRIGIVAGCYVQDGKVMRNAEARLVRDGVIVWQGKMNSLKRFKEDAREVPSGMECGIGLQDFNDIKVGDAIEVFEIKEIRPTLD